MMAAKLIQIPVESYELSAAIHFPINAEDKAPVMIFVHGFIGNKIGEHRMFVKAANFFSSLGYVCVRFDFSGCGESDGLYKELSFSKKVTELKAVISYISHFDGIGNRNITLVGHSLGGAVTAMVAPSLTNINKIVLWAPVARPYKDIVSITSEEAVVLAKKEGKYDFNGFEISHTFFEDLKLYNPLKTVSLYSGPLLIIHGDQDQDVPYTNADEYFYATNRSERYIIKDADHTFSSHYFEDTLFHQTHKWLEYLTLEQKTGIESF
jgi:uncharacterized protein